jgi:hypothetical protein
MEDFFSKLLGNIKNVFAPAPDFDTNIADFQKRIDTVITDIMIPAVTPSANSDRFREILSLLDPTKCNKIALTLSANLDRYKKVQLEQFASTVLVGKDLSQCTDSECSVDQVANINNTKSKVSKKQLCNAIAVHYVKILNLVAAILTAVNPVDNICLNRMRNLLTVISQENKQGTSAICDFNVNPIKNSILEEPGFKELLMLYYFHMAQDIETAAEKEQVKRQLGFLIDTFKNTVYLPSVEKTEKLIEKFEQPILVGNSSIANIVEDIEGETESLNSNNKGKSRTNIDKIRSNIKNFKNFQKEESEKLSNLVKKIENLSKTIKEIKTNQNESKPTSVTQNTSLGDVSVETLNTSSNIQRTGNLSKNTKKNNNRNQTGTNNNRTKRNSNVTTSQNNTGKKSEMNEINKLIADMSTTPPVTESQTTSPPPPPPSPPSPPTPTPSPPPPTPSTDSPVSNQLSSEKQSDILGMQPEQPLGQPEQPLGQPEQPLGQPEQPLGQPEQPLGQPEQPLGQPEQPPVQIQSQPQQLAQQPAQLGGSTKNNKKQKNNTSNNLNNLNNLNLSNLNNIENTKTVDNTMNKSKTGKTVHAMNMNENMNENNKEFEPENNKEFEPENNKEFEPENNKEFEPENNKGEYRNVSQIIPQLNNKKLTLIDKFKEFIASYSKITNFDLEKINMYGLDVISSSAFKQQSNYNKDDPVTGKYFIDEDEFANFCVDNSTNNIINLNLDDEKFEELIKIYKDMKNMYINNCETLLATLEKNILIKVPENDNDKSPKFTLKDLNYTELVEQETNVRNQLGQMYAMCHDQYQAGISALYNALKKQPDTTGF